MEYSTGSCEETPEFGNSIDSTNTSNGRALRIKLEEIKLNEHNAFLE